MSSYYPRPAKEAELDAVFRAWPVTTIVRHSDRSNMRFAL